MSMVKKIITITDQQDSWIKEQVKSGHFDSESELFRDLIHECQMRQKEIPADIATIRAALIKGEESGLSDLSIDEIWEIARDNQKRA